MKFIPASIPDVILIEPKVFGDERGYFMETFQAAQFAEAGIPTHFVQDNQSGSRKGILRGLHYQIQHTQGKLMRAIFGEIFDVAVDIRQGSPTFGKWVGFYLSAENKKQVWVPEGFAHGFYVVSDWAEVHYKTTDFYAPAYERSLIWNDPTVGVDWPIPPGTTPLLSSKDSEAKGLNQIELFP